MSHSNALSQSKNYSLLIFFMLLCGFFSMTQGQDVNADLLGYHYYNGYALWHYRYDWDFFPALFQTYFNPVLDSLTYLIISGLQKPLLLSFVLGSLAGINLFIIYNIANVIFINEKHRKLLNILSVAISATAVANVSLMATSTNDVAVTIFILSGFYYFLRYSLDEQQAYLVTSALLMGLAVGLKLTAACYALALLFTFLMVQSRTLLLKRFCLYVFLLGVGFLAVNGFWMLFVFLKFHNPIFPLYNNFFHSPFSPDISFNFNATNQEFAWYKKLIAPIYLAFGDNYWFIEIKTNIHEPRVLLLCILSFFYLIQLRFKKSIVNPAWQTTAIFMFVGFLLWAAMFMVYRYFLAIELLTGIGIVYLSAKILQTPQVCWVYGILLVIFLGLGTNYFSFKVPYHAAFFAVQSQSIEDNSYVLMTTPPRSYYVTFLNPKAHYVGMPFITLGDESDETAHRVSDHHSFLLTRTVEMLRRTNNKIYIVKYVKPSITTSNNLKILAHFGFVPRNCRKLQTNLDTFMLCDV